MSLHNKGNFGIMAWGVIIMDLRELNENIRRHERLDRAYEMLQSLREKADVQAPNMDGMPHGTDVSDKVGNLAVAMADLSARIDVLEDQTDAGDDAIREFANTFDDERLQMVIQLRFISCFTWSQTADLLGPAYTANGVRKLVCGALDG